MEQGKIYLYRKRWYMLNEQGELLTNYLCEHGDAWRLAVASGNGLQAYKMQRIALDGVIVG